MPLTTRSPLSPLVRFRPLSASSSLVSLPSMPFLREPRFVFQSFSIEKESFVTFHLHRLSPSTHPPPNKRQVFAHVLRHITIHLFGYGACCPSIMSSLVWVLSWGTFLSCIDRVVCFNQRVFFFVPTFFLFYGVTHHCTITDCWVEFEGVFLNIMGVSRQFSFCLAHQLKLLQYLISRFSEVDHWIALVSCHVRQSKISFFVSGPREFDRSSARSSMRSIHSVGSFARYLSLNPHCRAKM